MADVVLTIHAKYRLLERGIDVHQAKKIAKSGKIIKTESNGTITKSGEHETGRTIIVISKKQGIKIIILTAYYGN